ncbi:MAG TPA: carboxypeptidase-like regulatory domain-containing protein [Phycisphaerales bacterium]|nr:carboxypeptidase-like regulatory domain-containing protein [Phycisphaerales bacterium]HMP36209.1 carboxypeptidase-like regulatory domain-containing protein [Phycisphaerales bacterium]
MTPRTAAVLLALLCVTLLGQGVMLAVMVRDGRSFHDAVLARLDALNEKAPQVAAHTPGSTPGAPSDDARLASLMWPNPTLRIVYADSDLPMADSSFSLTGNAYQSEQRTTLDRTTDGAGRAAIGPVRPGTYRIHARSPAGYTWDLPLTIAPGESEGQEVRIPRDPEMASVSFNLSWPAEYTDDDAFVILALEAARLVVEPSGQIRTESRYRPRPRPLGDLGEGKAPTVWAAARRDGRSALVSRELLDRISALRTPRLDPDALGLDWGAGIPIHAAERIDGEVEMEFNASDALGWRGLTASWENDGEVVTTAPGAIRLDGTLRLLPKGGSRRVVR